MKYKYLSLLFFICFIAHAEETYVHRTQAPVHFIGAWYGGFFASFNCVLNHLLWCDQNNHIPIVYWGPQSMYYDRNGFNGSYNAWEYYFEPVASINPPPSSPITLTFIPDGMKEMVFCGDYIDDNTRQLAYEIITKYIKIKPIVMQKIENFYQTYMQGKHTIGIHLRGTDKGIEEKLVSPQKIITIALQHANDNTQFLLASDEERLMNEMIYLLRGRKIIYYDCYRSPNSTPLHVRGFKPPFAQLGEDVLVESLLLARSAILVHSLSNVSSASLYFNPGLKHITVRQDGLSTSYPWHRNIATDN